MSLTVNFVKEKMSFHKSYSGEKIGRTNTIRDCTEVVLPFKKIFCRMTS